MIKAFFSREKDCFVATEFTRGPWDDRFQHGGPPAGLMMREVERLLPEDTHLVARFTINFMRPIPIAPLFVSAQVERAGKTVQMIKVTLAAKSKEVAYASVVCIRKTSLALQKPSLPKPGNPLECEPFSFPIFANRIGYDKAMEFRIANNSFSTGDKALWMRMRYPLVQGETPSALQRIATTSDAVSGVGFALDIKRYTYVNPDLTVYLHRLPLGEWICLDAKTIPQPNGIAFSEAALFDTESSIGRALQSHVVQERTTPI